MLLLAGYLLLFPPLFVLGPLAGLLVASRPRTGREWAWIGAAILWIGFSLTVPGGMAWQTAYAVAMFVTAVFVFLMLFAGRRVVPGALLAAGAGIGIATVGLQALGVQWRAVQLAVAHGMWAMWREQAQLGGTTLFGNASDIEPAANVLISTGAELFPGLLVLVLLPGLSLAWSWYHRLADQPGGAAPERFADFRFSDQLVWGVVLGMIALVLPLSGPAANVVANLALVVGVLYVARGVAVLWGSLAPLPTALLLLLGVGVLFIFPVALGAAFALGLADTWVDFRRRRTLAGQTRE